MMLFIAAAANALWGIAAFANDDYFAADELLCGTCPFWGGIYLAIAAVQLGQRSAHLQQEPPRCLGRV